MLVQVPLRWPLAEVEVCLQAALRAINGEGDSWWAMEIGHFQLPKTPVFNFSSQMFPENKFTHRR